MAGNTRRLHGAVIHFIHRKGHGTAVTERTFISRHTGWRQRGNMITWLGHHTGIGTTVTSLTGSGSHASMTECRRQPGGKTLVTVFTRQHRGHMGRRLNINIRIRTGMARGATGSRHTGMGIRRNERQPGQTGTMAGIARHGCRNMRCRFTTGIDTVMAGGTASGHNAHVGKRSWFPQRGGVTGVTRLRGRNMRHGFYLRINGRVSTTVAGNAITGRHRACGSGMTHHTRIEGRETGVTDIALRRGRDMVGRLTQRTGAVMAGAAVAGNGRGGGGMIKGRRRPAGGGTVAGITLRRGHHMGCGFGLGIL